jgi:hypothetical protein
MMAYPAWSINSSWLAEGRGEAGGDRLLLRP